VFWDARSFRMVNSYLLLEDLGPFTFRVMPKQPNVALTLIPLTWRIWWAPNNASRWQMGFNSAFKVLKLPLEHIGTKPRIKKLWLFVAARLRPYALGGLYGQMLIITTEYFVCIITLTDNFTPESIAKFWYPYGTNLGISDEGESSISFSSSVYFVTEYRRCIKWSAGYRTM